jgi:hypothetical protein
MKNKEKIKQIETESLISVRQYQKKSRLISLSQLTKELIKMILSHRIKENIA